MRQQISSAQMSSSPVGDYGSFDARDTNIFDIESRELFGNLFAKGFGHLTTCVVNKMRNTHQCKECQKIILDITDCLNLFDSYLIHEDCDEILSDCWEHEESAIQSSSPTMHISIRLSCSQRKNLDKNINTLQNKIETLGTKIQHLNDEFIRFGTSLQRLSEECSSLKNNCQEQNTSISKLKLGQDMIEQNLLEIRQKMEDYHYATYNGPLVWIIPEVEKKFQDARSGQQTSIYSPIFYSSPSGYKMRARLDLYGDGDAQGTHMSIFLVILKGKFDAILKWPFNFQFIFCLFDQTGQGHHIIDSFYPDTTSTSFQRPRSEMNRASGILKFCPLAFIQQQENHYVRNDKIYIKIMVDFLGIPRPLLPYTLSLNPGLPARMQEDINRRKMEQYNQVRAALVEKINRNTQEVVRLSFIHMYPPVPAQKQQQLPPSTMDSESVPCEDILDD